MVSSVLGATSIGEGPGEVTVRPLRPPQRARLLEKWIRVAEVRERIGPDGDCGVERGPTAMASLCDPHRSAVCSETSLRFMLLYRPCSPAPSTGFGQPGGKQPGGEDGALDRGQAGKGWASQAHPQDCCPPSPRDSLRVFSSLCQIFSEEDNYSQSRELLLQVRPYSLAFPAIPALPAPLAYPLVLSPPGGEAAALAGAKFQESPEVWLPGWGE